VSNTRLPKITLSVFDRSRLERLARVAAAQGHPAAHFLLAEIGRAETVRDDATELDSVVTVGSSVTYWLNWGSPCETRTLVYPEEYTSGRSHICVLSPLGAALVGLKSGSQMPFFDAGRMHVARVESVSRSEPNVVPLFPIAIRACGDSGDDPGPSAA
jgi:regulator of nucleoside diphosphate kinase